MGVYGWLPLEEKKLGKLDSHAPLCPCRQGVLPSTRFSLHALICPDSCQISPLTSGFALARPWIFPFSIHSSFKKFVQPYFRGELNSCKTLQREREFRPVKSMQIYGTTTYLFTKCKSIFGYRWPVNTRTGGIL